MRVHRAHVLTGESLQSTRLWEGYQKILSLCFSLLECKKAWKKTADGRVEMLDHPERAVSESLVNALILRKYLEFGSEVHIDMFDDRIEIYSPGGMYDGTKVQDRNLCYSGLLIFCYQCVAMTILYTNQQNNSI